MDEPFSRDSAFNSSMRSLSRFHIGGIWKRGQAGEPLEGEDATYYQVMLQHPEYREFWEQAGELGDREVMIDGVNPYMHVAMHAVVERQISDKKPPEVDQMLFRLMRTGMDRHDAVHRIAQILSEFLWQILREKKPFDEKTYRRRLRAAKP